MFSGGFLSRTQKLEFNIQDIESSLIEHIYFYAPKFLSTSQGDFAPFFVKAGITPVQHINNSLL